MDNRLIKTAKAGSHLDLTHADLKVVSAADIRDLLLGRVDGQIDPKGIRLTGAQITDHLDLTDVNSTVALHFQRCQFDHPVVLVRAQLSTVTLRRVVLPSLHARRLRLTQSLDLVGLTANGGGEEGAVCLSGAYIGGDLDLTGARLSNEAGPALFADSLKINGSATLGGLAATGCGNDGAVRVFGSCIGGDLDLTGAKLSNKAGPVLSADNLKVGRDVSLGGLVAINCSEYGAVQLTGAHIGGSLYLRDADLTNEAGPSLFADNLTVDADAVLGSLTATGAVRLVSAHIGGRLDLTEANLTNEVGAALSADGLTVYSSAALASLTATGRGDDGTVQLSGAHIGGLLDLTSANLTNEAGASLFANDLTVDRSAILAGLKATGRGDDGAVGLFCAHIGGDLNLIGATLTNETGVAMIADSLKVDNDVILDGLTATGHSESGAVRLAGAHIRGRLQLSDSLLTNEAGAALFADGLTVDGGAMLTGLTAAGWGDDGAIRLLGARIGGVLTLTSANLTNEAGPAMLADRLTTDSRVALGGLTAVGRSDGGAVRLLGARIGGVLDLTGANLTNKAGPALLADRLTADGSAELGGLTATGRGDDGTVGLAQAHIGGVLSLRGAKLTNEAGPALYAPHLQVDDDANLQDLIVTGRGPFGLVQLMGARIGGELVLSGHASGSGDERVLLNLNDAKVAGRFSLWNTMVWQLGFQSPSPLKAWVDGFTYSVPPEEPDAETWLKVLQCAPRYTPQPYRQLAEVYRAAGDEPQSRTVLIKQQEALGRALHKDHAPWRVRAWHWISRVTVRYGYQSSRALGFLLAVVAASCALMIIADVQGWFVHPSSRGGNRCGIVETLGSAVDRNVPLLGFSVAGRCELTNVTPAQWFFVASLFLQVLSWVFISLFVAGFTGVVRKPNG